MKSVAVICFENPFNKPSDGAKNDMKTRVLALAKSGQYTIDIYCFNKTNEQPSNIDNSLYNIRNYFQYTVGKTTIPAFLGSLPLSVYKRYTPECRDELRKHHYDAIIYEGEHMSSYRLKGDTSADKHILRQHDIESAYRLELSRSAQSKKEQIAQKMESEKYEKLEKKIDTYFDDILFISKAEKETFDKRYKGTKSKFIFMPPSTMRFSDGVASGKNRDEILYFGNMELQNNFLSILWFVEKVFPLILKKMPEVKLTIIGKISDGNKEKLKGKNVSVLGYVDDLNEAVQNACFVVSPVLFGAGVKVKVVDALSYGQIVVATSKAIEGTELENGKHLLVEDKPNRFAEKCIDILKDREKFEELAKTGLEFVKKYHSIKYQAEILESVLI